MEIFNTNCKINFVAYISFSAYYICFFILLRLNFPNHKTQLHLALGAVITKYLNDPKCDKIWPQKNDLLYADQYVWKEYFNVIRSCWVAHTTRFVKLQKARCEGKLYSKNRNTLYSIIYV